MLLILLAYFGGILTILSPCILPVLPFVFARAGRSFMRSTLPMLAGMAATFAIVATLAAVGGGWAVRANQAGRWAALLLLALFGIALIFPSLSDRLTRPLVALGARMSERAGTGENESVWGSAVLGVATGLLWAPCAGPILGIIFTAAAIKGASFNTTLLLLAYAAGAATSLALALLVGGKLFTRMKKSLGTSERIRQGLGVAVLVGVAAIAFGLDTRVLAKLSSAQTARFENRIAAAFGVAGTADSATKTDAAGKLVLPVEGMLPPLDGIGPWFNSPPLTREQLRGKVVVIDFWTYSCINCIRSLPYVRAWAERYKKDGLVVIGVHAPEFAFEREPANVAKAIKDLGVTYPVALDNKYSLWSALKNNYWPAHYFVDAEGRIRYHHFGEGDYERSEQVIRQLLTDAGHPPSGGGMAVATATGAQAQANRSDVRSPETYVGYGRADKFASPGGLVRDKPATYALAPLALNQWALGGQWLDAKQNARSLAPGAQLSFRFHSRDLHLVLGSPSGKAVRFRVTLDGKPPGKAAGLDVDSDGTGKVRDQRLYQLVRQHGPIEDRTFTITFLDPGVEAFAFTFG